MRRVSWNLASCHATVQKLLVLDKSKLWSWRIKVGRCVINVHSTVTRSSRFHCLIGVISKPTTVELCIAYHLYTDDLLWRNFLGPQYRNCSCDPDHAHLGNTHSSQDEDFEWPTCVQNLKSLGSPVTTLWMAVQNAENGGTLGQLGGTQGHRQCHHSIERIGLRLPIRL